jgi:hypothetical protein
MPNKCSIDQCDKRIHSYKADPRGLCLKHHKATRDLCAIEGCKYHVHSWKADPRGLCLAHHRYMLTFGTPEVSMEQRLSRFVDKSAGPDGCWTWLGGQGAAGGYGRFNNKSPHVLAYQFAYGDIPEGLYVDHQCHHPSCVNPKHLRAVTPKQNSENRRGAYGRSGLRGVRQRKNGSWIAQVVHSGKSIHVGTFATAEEAAEAARLKRCELYTNNVLDRR